ncbi:MAG: cytochrome c [bacterium]
MNCKIIFSTILLGGVLAGCVAALYTPSISDVRNDASLTELNNGRALYVAKCGSCHTLKLPSEYAPDVWQENLDEMQQRAKISDGEKSSIFKYLRAGAKIESRQ